MTSRNAVRRSVSAAELPAFTPVPRKLPRHDGWTVERQRAFIEALADTGCVSIACRMVNMSQPSFYQLRRQPGAESFRAAADAAQSLGLQPVKDEAFHRAMHGQLVPVFVGGKLMGFRRKKNDRLLMFILRHYGQDPSGRKTTVNYFSTRASAGAAAPSGRQPTRSGALTSARDAGSGRPTTGEAVSIDVTDSLRDDAFSLAQASTTTVRTTVSGPAAQSQIAADDEAAAILNAFEGVDLDPEAQAEIYRALEACAERRRALEHDPENDPERIFIGAQEAGAYLGELEGGCEDDWVEYRPEGEHRWENLGEDGQAAEIDRVLAEIEQRKLLPAPAEAGDAARIRAEIEQQSRIGSDKEQDPDDPRLDWRNWQEGGFSLPPEPPPSPPAECAPDSACPGHRSRDPGPVPSPRKAYKKRTPKPSFTSPDEVRKAEAMAEVEADRRVGAAAEAERRERKARRGER